MTAGPSIHPPLAATEASLPDPEGIPLVPARWHDGGRSRAGLAVDGSRPREPALVPAEPIQATPVQATGDFSV